MVRSATIDDLDSLALLFDAYRVFYRKPSDLDAAKAFLRARFDLGDSILLVAEANTAIVGFAQLFRSYSSASLGRVLILNDLYVAEVARKKGIGRALMEESLRLGKALGAVRMDLSTERTNETAQRLYAQLGWTRDEVFVRYHINP